MIIDIFDHFTQIKKMYKTNLHKYKAKYIELRVTHNI